MIRTRGIVNHYAPHIPRMPAPPRPIFPRGYEAIGMCCACGFLGFIRLLHDARWKPRSVCSDCEGVARPMQPGELARIAPRSATRARKADAA